MSLQSADIQTCMASSNQGSYSGAIHYIVMKNALMHLKITLGFQISFVVDIEITIWLHIQGVAMIVNIKDTEG